MEIKEIGLVYEVNFSGMKRVFGMDMHHDSGVNDSDNVEAVAMGRCGGAPFCGPAINMGEAC